MDRIATRLEACGPEGVFLRFVLAHTGRTDLFAVEPGGLIGGGLAANVFVASSHWLFADDAATAAKLVATAIDAPRVHAVYWVAPADSAGARGLAVRPGSGAGPARPPRSTRPRSSTARTSSAALDRLDPELADHIAPPHIQRQLPFRYHALVHEGRIVALCDTTVDDGTWAAIQQVHTVRALMRRGLATRLVRGVVGFLHSLGRRPVWVCDADNAASRRTAQAAGLRIHRRVTRLSRASSPPSAGS